MIRITLNETSIDVSESTHLLDFVTEHVSAQDFAIAVNEVFIPKDQYGSYQLQQGDNIDLLVPMQGG